MFMCSLVKESRQQSSFSDNQFSLFSHNLLQKDRDIVFCTNGKTRGIPIKTESTVRVAVSLTIRTGKIIFVGICIHLSYIDFIDILDDILSKQDSYRIAQNLNLNWN